MAKSSQLFEHAQRYMREVMAPRLREEGFVSYKGEDIHWYRLVNNEVVQAIYFGTRHTALQSSFSIYIGFHPLFIPPVFQKSPYFRAEPGFAQMSYRVPELVPGSTPHGIINLMLYGLYNRVYRIPDVLIPCPRDKNDGLDILNQVFSIFESVKTPKACYEMHKRMQEIESVFSMSTYFVDEVLFWGDKELYPYCQQYMEDFIAMLRKAQESGKFFHKTHEEELERLLAMKDAFSNREQYLQVLKEREQKTLHLLEKYTGIRWQD